MLSSRAKRFCPPVEQPSKRGYTRLRNAATFNIHWITVTAAGALVTVIRKLLYVVMGFAVVTSETDGFCALAGRAGVKTEVDGMTIGFRTY